MSEANNPVGHAVVCVCEYRRGNGIPGNNFHKGEIPEGTVALLGQKEGHKANMANIDTKAGRDETNEHRQKLEGKRHMRIKKEGTCGGQGVARLSTPPRRLSSRSTTEEGKKKIEKQQEKQKHTK